MAAVAGAVVAVDGLADSGQPTIANMTVTLMTADLSTVASARWWLNGGVHIPKSACLHGVPRVGPCDINARRLSTRVQ
ncbi:MAG TPA: hypothetical protein VKA77_14085 [Mycobacterium sp.]|nr:hypothetical protein [Mycobacterium sp.]